MTNAVSGDTSYTCYAVFTRRQPAPKGVAATTGALVEELKAEDITGSNLLDQVPQRSAAAAVSGTGRTRPG